ncbi:hypothetical protein MRX96_024396 [Rhipicephalus microplus]
MAATGTRAERLDTRVAEAGCGPSDTDAVPRKNVAMPGAISTTVMAAAFLWPLLLFLLPSLSSEKPASANIYTGTVDMPGKVSDLRARTKETPLWPGGVVHYIIDDAFDSWEKEEILSAMQQIESVSCVQFRERADEEGYIHILSKQGCFSEVGMSGLRQLVSLNFEVCATYGTIVHELLHVLGLWHEQSRADRDRYVRVVWNNVVPRFKANFMKTNRVPYLEEDYDYESIMHYFFNAFSKDPEQATLVDIHKLNTIYHCPTDKPAGHDDAHHE